ncbi:hypothetical protein [Virgibacillus oceani]|uniref:Uncharacterized protein n=1 Tax=Virgibacillus oceani TaxID=1479511 RepID=A0A917LZK6_9BACI|nr:hypothetical protein [Virgibacillus oceani]GGG67720.1 hypothetical protein GCM10011398_09370 [Virgibacillus oceani]
MNREMIDDLLQTIIHMSGEVKELQRSGSRLDELVSDIEVRINNVALDLNGLQQNVRNIDKNVTLVVKELSKIRVARPTAIHKAVN